MDDINRIELAIAENPNLLLSRFTDIFIDKDKITAKCPIHSGDNTHSLYIRIGEGRGSWKCFSRGCHSVFCQSLIGLARGLLSSYYCGWKSKGDEVYSFGKTLNYLRNLYDGKLEPLTVERLCDIYDRKEVSQSGIICSKSKYLSRNKHPSQYFINRGFSKEILDKFYIYSCQEDTIFKNRSLVPVFSEDGVNVLGITARSEIDEVPKWKHTKNFPGSTTLYNIWNAAGPIKRARRAVLVEGPCDVWRLEEAGINIGLALFGGYLTPKKALTLDKMGIMRLDLCLDNDESGAAFMETIVKEYSSFYNIKKYKLPDGINDIAELPIEDVRKVIKL